MFPREQYHWYTITNQNINPFFDWVKNNIPLQKRILMLTSPTPYIPSNLSNLNLITEVGTLTPLWGLQPKAFYGADISPIYLDVFYTLNPEFLKILKLDYIVVSDQYLSQLPEDRIKDLSNTDFFQITFQDPLNNLAILKVTPNYLSSDKNYKGTIYELTKIAPQIGSYFIEDAPNIQENIYRALRLSLNDREMHYNFHAAFYNFQVDIDLKYYGEPNGDYDYLILGDKTDPKSLCKCNTKLLWQGLGNGVKVWQTNEIN